MEEPNVKKWENYEDWDSFSEIEKTRWKELSELIVDIFCDFKTQGVLSIAFGPYALPEEHQVNTNFMKILRHQNRLQQVTNMWLEISGTTTAKRFLERNPELNDEDFAYTYLSQFTNSILQSVELFRNAFLKMLNTDMITNRQGKKVENLGNMGLFGILEIMKKYSKKVDTLFNIIDEGKELRRAFAHGVWWFENNHIFWIRNIYEPKLSEISFKDLFKNIRKQSLLTQCLIWVIGNLISEGLFRP